jgi:hypothetical protein
MYNELRREVARRYLAEISNDKIVLPHWELSNNHVFICLLLEQQTERNCKVIEPEWNTNGNPLSDFHINKRH